MNIIDNANSINHYPNCWLFLTVKNNFAILGFHLSLMIPTVTLILIKNPYSILVLRILRTQSVKCATLGFASGCEIRVMRSSTGSGSAHSRVCLRHSLPSPPSLKSINLKKRKKNVYVMSIFYRTPSLSSPWHILGS